MPAIRGTAKRENGKVYIVMIGYCKCRGRCNGDKSVPWRGPSWSPERKRQTKKNPQPRDSGLEGAKSYRQRS